VQVGPRRRARRHAAGVTLGAFLGVAWAHDTLAQSPPGVVAAFRPFDYTAPEGCPTRAEFEQQVARKLGADAPADTRTDLHLAALTVTESGGYSVRITFRPEQGTDRTLVATSCADAVAGAALVIALAIDPARATAAAPSVAEGAEADFAASAQPSAGPEDSSDPATPPAAAAALGSEPEPLPAAPADPLAPVAEPSAPLRPRPLPSAESPDETAIRRQAATSPAAGPALLAGAGFGTNTWLAPRLARQFQVFAELEPLRGTWSLRATGYRGDSSATINGRGATFGVWGGRVDFAPYVFGRREHDWRLAIAGMVDLASIRARGEASSQLAVSASQHFLWVDAGALARLLTPEWYRLRLELQGELLVPLRRPTFNFDAPFEVIHTPPALAVAAHIALGVRLF
jgi:hypothetical protein